MNINLMIYLFLGLLALVIGLGAYLDPTYSGKEVFQTQQEYSDFKQAVGVEGIRLVDVEVLSSEPPIVVQYKVKTTGYFPYGEREVYHFYIAGVFAICCLVGVGIEVVDKIKNRKEEEEKYGI